MAFLMPHHWVWDFWLADDGKLFHMYFLHAPHTLFDPELRHRNARIGHATSRDLTAWTVHEPALGPGPAGAFDGTATWTGSVVRGPDELWRMFYTGSLFPSPDSFANIETIGLATSPDLFIWTKVPGPVLRANPRWYETLGTSSWPEEAWRDPWVFRDPVTGGWRMLVTARANSGDDFGRGVIGHATSPDLEHWQAQPPLSTPQSGFCHLEVPQLVNIEGHGLLLFSCNAPRLANTRIGEIGGIWIAPVENDGTFDIGRATLLVDERLYAGRLVRDRAGVWNLLAFVMTASDGNGPGGICDPLPVHWRDGRLTLTQPY